MAGQGVAPLDPATLVGQVRGLVGDTAYAELDPPVTGQGIYPYFSDVELLGFLAAGSQSVYRAAGNAVAQLAVGAALIESQQRPVTTDDLQIGAAGGAADLRQLATSYFKLADEADAQAIIDDSYFSITSFDRFGFKHVSSTDFSGGAPSGIPGYLRP